jgi:predicted O-methyltransferase YrrM
MNGIPTSLTEMEAATLRDLAQGERVVEVGSAYGFSTILMALVARQVTAIDPHTGLGSFAVFLANLEEYGVRRKVRNLAIPSADAWPALAEEIKVRELPLFDGAFIDGDHRYDAVVLDFKWARQLVQSDGWIACHDYGEDTCPDVIKALPVPDRLVDTLAVYAR